ncbi:hypothetical protein HAX54_018286 [Datura stramonium]|uniref:Uncharacterized protein n=1 Tax=Datura stramonium TaxID=4076 RepID=A0ABS8UP79_DATST|nr:hypothetical protein [Datura stramonium]
MAYMMHRQGWRMEQHGEPMPWRYGLCCAKAVLGGQINLPQKEMTEAQRTEAELLAEESQLAKAEHLAEEAQLAEAARRAKPSNFTTALVERNR